MHYNDWIGKKVFWKGKYGVVIEGDEESGPIVRFDRKKGGGEVILPGPEPKHVPDYELQCIDIYGNLLK